MKKLFICLAAVALCACCCKEKKAQTPTYPFALNIAVAEFGHDVMPGEYGKDYIYPEAGDFDSMKSKGFTLARIPFKWERILDTLGGGFNQRDLTHLKGCVTAAAQRGIDVILDLHNYGRYWVDGDHQPIGTHGITIGHLTDLWGKLAAEFSSFTNIYGYALMNEPHDMDPGTPWKDIAQACIYAIREADPKTAIIVGGDSWSSAERWQIYSDNLKYLYDPSENLIFEAHVYFDKDNSGTYKYDYEGEQCHKYFGIQRVQPFVNWLKVNGKRGFIGEYGIPGDDPRWLETLDYFLAYLSRNNINGAYWAAGPWWPEDHFMALRPKDGVDKPQMEVLRKYLRTNPEPGAVK